MSKLIEKCAVSEYPQRDGQANLVGLLGWTQRQYTQQMVNHLSTNPAQCRVTLLMRPTSLPSS